MSIPITCNLFPCIFGKFGTRQPTPFEKSTMPLSELTDQEFHREINTNLFGPLLTIRESLNHFGPDGGSIINIGSAASRLHPPGYSVYTASKAGLDAVTGVLAKELALKPA